MNIFRTRYRIVKDDYAGYEAQYRHWWMPFYIQVNGVNTRPTLEACRKLIEFHKRPKFVEQVQ